VSEVREVAYYPAVLVPLIPPPRAHQVRYHGVLAPCASARDRIVPGPARARASPAARGPSAETIPELAGMRPWLPVARHRFEGSAPTDPGPATHANTADLHAGPGAPPADGDPLAANRRDPDRDPAVNGLSPRRPRWAELLQRIFDVDALRCPRCGAPMRLVAAIEDPSVARKILECLGLPARAPPLEPALADTQDLGQSEGDWLFDQSPIYDEP